MGYYVIGIGGTGAKCVEALTHLCSSGMMPDGELYTLFVDPDGANGNLERSQITLQQYVNCKQLKFGKTDLFKTTITIAKPDVWSPFGESKPSLSDFFNYITLKVSKPEVANLFDVLYTPAEKETALNKGVRGHPSIGAAVMAETVDFVKGEPWNTFRNKIATDVKSGQKTKVFLIGSIFGGTGAAGFPTIARLIHDVFKQKKTEVGKAQESSGGLEIGGALLLPYFSFIPEGEDKELRASSEDFLMSTKASLKYYYQKKYNEIFTTIYLLGDEDLSPVKKFSIGSNTQKNEPHFIELYAALAAINFFNTDGLTDYQMIAREELKTIKWGDLPDSNFLKPRLGRLAGAAFAYLSVYHPILKDISANGKGYRAPWFIDYDFFKSGISIEDGGVKWIKDYCEGFVSWLTNIHTSAKGQNIELFNWNAFTGMTLTDFGNLVLPIKKKGDSDTLGSLWEYLCYEKVNDPESIGFGKFIRNLYDGCEII